VTVFESPSEFVKEVEVEPGEDGKVLIAAGADNS